MDETIFPERVFDVAGQKISCRFFTPHPDGEDFRCAYEISSLSTHRCGHAMGIDGVQALLNAMTSAHFALQDWRAEVTWLGSKCLGLPGLDDVINQFTPAGRRHSPPES